MTLICENFVAFANWVFRFHEYECENACEIEIADHHVLLLLLLFSLESMNMERLINVAAKSFIFIGKTLVDCL